MWAIFSRQTLAESGIMEGMTDYHSHILFGVDDGIRTLEESLDVLRLYENIGVRNLWLTPHIMEDYPNHPTDLRRKFQDYITAYANSSQNPVALRLASENMLDSLFLKRLENDELLPIMDGRHLLVETSYYNPSFGFDNLLTQIAGKGYVPVLAHPERYHYMAMSDYEDLRKRGVKLQLDLLSVVGAYGKDVRDKACELLKQGSYSMAGSDLHNLSSFTGWLNVPVRKNLLTFLKTLINR